LIVADSSVWIAHLRDAVTEPVRQFRTLGAQLPLLVGDVILLEVLQGARNPTDAMNIEREMRRFEMVAMLSPDLAVEAAANYRLLRSRGVTPRKTVDLIIGTFCIEHGHTLLHDDRDFEPMRAHLGLQVL
jgi:predicted nucleic acid-binding protein